MLFMSSIDLIMLKALSKFSHLKNISVKLNPIKIVKSQMLTKEARVLTKKKIKNVVKNQSLIKMNKNKINEK